MNASFDRHQIRRLLSRLGQLLAQEGKIAEVAIFGGSAVSLMFDYRESTQDIDFMPVSGDIHRLRELSVSIAREEDIPEDWLNDAVEIFKSDSPDYRLFGEFPVENPGIRVFTATPEYILAMKVMAMRNSLESSDVLDVWHLVDAVNVRSFDDVINIAAKFYPDKEVPKRNSLILMDLMEEKLNGGKFSSMIGW